MKKFLAIALATIITATAFAESADDVMRKMTGLEAPVSSASTLKMEFLDKNGNVTETRQMRQFGMKDHNSLKKTIFYFDTPASVKGTRVLQVENKGKDDDKWAYEPSLRTTRQIAASSRRASFVGSDFTYNDMTVRKFEDDKNKMLEENATVTVLGKKYNCWKVESTPVKKDVEFTYRYIWVDKESFLPMRIEFYDRKGLFKEWETLGYRMVKGADGKVNYTLRNGAEVRNLRTGHGTRVTVTKVEFDNPKSIKQEYFTTNWLNTGKF
ncbi:MAG: outer membrane lipoprotein-sorting protein [Treponema sp.]|nr:outer membrane lipoprotein-sorting protein [Treponema sp.]